MQIRKPVVAGQFYEAGRQELIKQISGLAKHREAKDILACILPHAGYIYSGKVAAETVSGINIKDTVILLGPNHTGHGAVFSLMDEGAWQTPLGDIKIDSELAKLFLKKSTLLESDALAHLYEHSLEVELPILQYFRPDFKIVPIAFMSANKQHLKSIASELAEAIIQSKRLGLVTLVASSDMTHYEPLESAERKDKAAIEAMLKLDEEKFLESIKELDISMCGYAPVYVLLQLAKLLGAKQAHLVRYDTSASVSKDKTSVVGYAGITIN
ncbi:MAG: AmmeMemoRadiSam system protein B [Candidatus Omnitrophota bacterium]|jgi:hypothetical protein